MPPALVHQPELTPDYRLSSGPTRVNGLAGYGEVFTQPWVVKLVLDLAGYTSDRDLAGHRAIEPACGRGAFLLPMIHRLGESCRRRGRSIEDATEAIYAVDLQPGSVLASREAAVKLLVGEGWPEATARFCVAGWIHEGDFILGADLGASADYVVGNPPYVRLEDIPPQQSTAYRRACPTMGGRADLFIGFYETGLRALKPGGTLAYICADRWMHNQYGRSLRAFIGEHFSVEATVVMHDVAAFEDDVSAYPAVTIIRRREQGPSVLAGTTARFGERDADLLLRWAKGTRTKPKRTPAFEVAELPHWHKGPEAWPSGSPEQLALIAELEQNFPRLQDHATGTRVGIGVATGADRVFVTTDADLVEDERLLPLSVVRDTKSGTFEWSGHYLVDPWMDKGSSGGLVDLNRYPRLRAYFEANRTQLRRRNIAGRRPRHWFRTIDRVDHGLTDRPKLLFPDMKMAMEPVYEAGGYYPHHNLYYVVSASWPMEVLGGLLLSQVADLFVRTYSVKMRGGTLRFQAQYMRRICVPPLGDLTKHDKRALAAAFEERDVERATGVALTLYGIKGALPGAGRSAGV